MRPHLVCGDSVDAAAEGHQLYQLHIRLCGDILGGTVHPGMVGPLVQRLEFRRLRQVRHAVLSDDCQPQAADQLMDAVVDLRVDVVGSAGKDDDLLSGVPRLPDDLFALCHNVFPVLAPAPQSRVPAPSPPAFWWHSG